MVAHRYLTEYQATLLARGHADGFYLNQYKILDRLGRGRMAGVYKAVHSLGQIVAIKVLPPSKARKTIDENVQVAC
jgi:serine/threonine protein kinase